MKFYIFIIEFEDIRHGDVLIDCSQYVNDIEVVNSFPYIVHIDPVFQYPTTTYASKNANGNIDFINIASQKSIPPMIYCLRHLSGLRIQNTSFYDVEQQLPLKIEYFASTLIYLGIYNTMIPYLPEHIRQFRRLEILELSNVGLISLPDFIGDLISLVTLSLPNNKLSSLPQTIGKLRLLRHIILKNNPRLRSVQPLNGLPSLSSLDARHCSIEDLPRNLPQLIDVLMTNNSLTRLVGIETLGSGTNKNKSFNFNINRIRSVSSEIRHVKNLRRLKLDGNELENLPSNIFNMLTLSHLDIRQNRFQRGELRTIVTMFQETNPKLKLHYSTK
jgi:hypothetical protein